MDKTEVLCTLHDSVEVEEANHALQCLKGDAWVKSLGGIYSETVPPERRFDTVINNMHKRMITLQTRRPTLMARILFCNSLMVSCVWFFAYFILPTPAQLERMDALVWGMIWGKEPGDEGSRGLKQGGLVTGRRQEGGLQILLPSIMIPALQANMVCRAITDRGRWWTRFFTWSLEQATVSRRGFDSLLLPCTNLGEVSVFWGGAVASWGALNWTHRTDRDAHRESVAALPMMEAVTVAGATDALWATLRESNYITLGDVWDYKSQISHPST